MILFYDFGALKRGHSEMKEAIVWTNQTNPASCSHPPTPGNAQRPRNGATGCGENDFVVFINDTSAHLNGGLISVDMVAFGNRAKASAKSYIASKVVCRSSC